MGRRCGVLNCGHYMERKSRQENKSPTPLRTNLTIKKHINCCVSDIPYKSTENFLEFVRLTGNIELVKMNIKNIRSNIGICHCHFEEHQLRGEIKKSLTPGEYPSLKIPEKPIPVDLLKQLQSTDNILTKKNDSNLTSISDLSVHEIQAEVHENPRIKNFQSPTLMATNVGPADDQLVFSRSQNSDNEIHIVVDTLLDTCFSDVSSSQSCLDVPSSVSQDILTSSSASIIDKQAIYAEKTIHNMDCYENCSLNMSIRNRMFGEFTAVQLGLLNAKAADGVINEICKILYLAVNQGQKVK